MLPIASFVLSFVIFIIIYSLLMGLCSFLGLYGTLQSVHLCMILFAMFNFISLKKEADIWV